MFNFLKQNSSPFKNLNSPTPISRLMIEEAVKISHSFRAKTGNVAFERGSALESVMILLSYGLYRIGQHIDSASVWKYALKKDLKNMINDETGNLLLLNGYKNFDGFAENRFEFAEINLAAMIEGDGTFMQLGLTKLVLERPLINLDFEIDEDGDLLLSEEYMCEDLTKVLGFTKNLVPALKSYNSTCNNVISALAKTNGSNVNDIPF